MRLVHMGLYMSDSPETESFSRPSAPDFCQSCKERRFVPRSVPTPSELDHPAEYVFVCHECLECGSRYNTNERVLSLVDGLGSVSVPTWQEIFGHPSPYPHQEEAITHLLDFLSGEVDGDAGSESEADGEHDMRSMIKQYQTEQEQEHQEKNKSSYAVIEGGCGTGKTMISLTAGLKLIRDPDSQYEQMFVLTSVKQQLRQFEDDLRIINQNLGEEIPQFRSVTMVGKGDLCPYVLGEKAGITEENINGRCRSLRKNTRWLNSERGTAFTMLSSNARTRGESDWEVLSEEVEYVDHIPSQQKEYCPFYAEYQRSGDPMFSFGQADDSILTPGDLVQQSMNTGVCPHSAMGVLCKDADVVIGNYYHVFDFNTRQITNELINENTLLVCDEAHMLEPRVRGIMSESASFHALQKAATEVGRVAAGGGAPIDREELDGSPVPRRVFEDIAADRVTSGQLQAAYVALTELHAKFNQSVAAYVDQNISSSGLAAGQRYEIPLRDPSDVEEVDSVTQWAEQRGIPDNLWELLPAIATVVTKVLDEVANSDYQVIEEVAELLSGWFRSGNETYFREITLTVRDDISEYHTGWKRRFRADLELHNVMPRSFIGSTLESFGGGVLMSATLEPMDVYEEVIGLDYLSFTGDVSLSEKQYTANFPKKNRASFILDAPRYTHSNRGSQDSMSDVREMYAIAIREVITQTDGNVLICMPSYSEGEWIAEILEGQSDIGKEVLVDGSASNEETQRLKQEFFDGDSKVLVTSLRGTLTEGVDYDGDKLEACVVCGIPIENMGSPKTQALKAAYEAQFGGAGFDYGLTVPAVRKTRQALGRVIRGSEDVGVRVLIDERYAGGQGSVHHYLSDSEQAEYEVVESVSELSNSIETFWDQV